MSVQKADPISCRAKTNVPFHSQNPSLKWFRKRCRCCWRPKSARSERSSVCTAWYHQSWKSKCLKPRLVQGLNKLNIFGVQGSTKLRGKDTINEKTQVFPNEVEGSSRNMRGKHDTWCHINIGRYYQQVIWLRDAEGQVSICVSDWHLRVHCSSQPPKNQPADWCLYHFCNPSKEACSSLVNSLSLSAFRLWKTYCMVECLEGSGCGWFTYYRISGDNIVTWAVVLQLCHNWGSFRS